MIKHLKYHVVFPTTHRKLEAELDFARGLGAITGPNEAGKSFVIEMVRYCLFGTAALRGAAEDYKTLRAELTFAVKGETYRVERRIGAARLYRGAEEIAVGIKPVNNKIAQMLGFGLEVFDVACVANQGDIEKLGSMKPTERKRMVDSVIGLSVIDELIKWAGDEALTLARQREGLEGTLREPQAPEQPADYRRTDELKAEIAALEPLVAEHHRLQGSLAESREAPKKPEESVAIPSENLFAFVEQERARKAEIAGLEGRLRALPAAPRHTGDELDRMEGIWDLKDRFAEKQRFLKAHPKPTLSLADVTDAFDHLDILEAWKRRQALRDRIEHLRNHEIDCPSCGASFPLGHDEIAKLEAEIEALGPLQEEHPGEPGITREQLCRIEAQWADWDAHAQEWALLEDAVDLPAPELDWADIARARAALAAAGERVGIERRLAELRRSTPAQDWEAMYRARLAYEQALARYWQDAEEHGRWAAARREKETRLVELAGKPEELARLRDLSSRSLAYEYAFHAYLDQKAVYDSTRARIGGILAEEAEWRKVKEALVRLRALVKQHLVPSVNRVAAHLLKGMTGGQRQSVVVDEDFNVAVDGQDLNTLSGSGKAVANLALRLALGQVLTNGVFSVFMGDEIDASMDADRAENTSVTLGTLKLRISQILLVTHKYPVADYHVTMGSQHDILETNG